MVTRSSTDIVERLRNFCVWNNRHSHYEPVPLCKEAADEIERLRASLTTASGEAATAAEAFHPESNLPGCMIPDGGDCCGGYQALLADWRRLRSAISEIQKATLEGRVCDDVAWFGPIETLHDFCDRTLNGADQS